MTSETDKDGRQRAFTFDSAGRTLTEKWINGAGQTVYTATLTYNSDGWRKTEQDPYSTYSLSYDADGHLRVSDNNGTPGAPHLILTWSYDALGNRSGLTDSLGGAVSYAYNADNSLTWASLKSSGTQGPQVSLIYDNEQRMTSIVRRVTSGGATTTSNVSFDNADRMTTITHSSSVAGALATYLYGYDGASQLTSYTGPEGNLTYGFDQSGELTTVRGARTEDYSYSLNGNRTMTGYTTGSGNRLLADGTYTYAFDAEGNTISKTRTSDGEQWTLSWDYRNRLTQDVEKTNAGVTVTSDQFTYDVEGRRIGKSVNGTQAWYAYDGQNTYADFNSGGSLTFRYLADLALDAIYARWDGTNVRWYLKDLIGSVRLFVDNSGGIQDQLTYDSFGTILTETSAANGDRFKYTAREWDTEIGLQYNRTRSYDPKSGRWLSEDPLGFRARDVNLFRYVFNCPLDALDPSGQTIIALFDFNAVDGYGHAGLIIGPLPRPQGPWHYFSYSDSNRVAELKFDTLEDAFTDIQLVRYATSLCYFTNDDQNQAAFKAAKSFDNTNYTAHFHDCLSCVTAALHAAGIGYTETHFSLSLRPTRFIGPTVFYELNGGQADLAGGPPMCIASQRDLITGKPRQ